MFPALCYEKRWIIIPCSASSSHSQFCNSYLFNPNHHFFRVKSPSLSKPSLFRSHCLCLLYSGLSEFSCGCSSNRGSSEMGTTWAALAEYLKQRHILQVCRGRSVFSIPLWTVTECMFSWSYPKFLHFFLPSPPCVQTHTHIHTYHAPPHHVLLAFINAKLRLPHSVTWCHKVLLRLSLWAFLNYAP